MAWQNRNYAPRQTPRNRVDLRSEYYGNFYSKPKMEWVRKN